MRPGDTVIYTPTGEKYKLISFHSGNRIAIKKITKGGWATMVVDKSMVTICKSSILKKILKVCLIVAFPLQAIPEMPILKIAVIDSGYYTDAANFPVCKESKDFTGQGFEDVIGHGQLVAHIIADRIVNRKFCIMILKHMHSPKLNGTDSWAPMFEYALQNGAQIINLSMTGTTGYKDEVVAIKNALNKGVKIVVAAGNDGINLDKRCSVSPVCYDKRLYVVGNTSKLSNYGQLVDIIINGNNISGGGLVSSGTSMSAAIFTSMLANIYLSK